MSSEKEQREVVVRLTEAQAVAAREACKNEGAMAMPRSEERKAWNGARQALNRALSGDDS